MISPSAESNVEAIEALKTRILALNERVWENRMPWPKVEQWLSNFTGRVTVVEQEQIHALYWLSQFIYFGAREIRVMLRSLYRDLYFCPMIQEVRGRIGKSATDEQLHAAVVDEERHTRFIGIGNPSESGVHLLYYFRQENSLSKRRFTDAVQIFTRSGPNSTSQSVLQKIGSWLCRGVSGEHSKVGELALRDPSIRRYVFLDDICGSGDTAVDYSGQILRDLLRLNPNAKVAYYSLFATSKGLDRVRSDTLFANNCAAVFELDATYRCLSENSRFFNPAPSFIDPVVLCRLAREYGNLLDPDYACGYKDSQLLLGFHHNTPDNTLGIMWFDSPMTSTLPWYPAFKRYPKIYGEGV